jgi:hypothetical protein
VIEIRFVLAKIGLVLLFLGLTMIQMLSIPGQFEHMRRSDGLSLYTEIALTFFVGLWILCAQIALFILWKIVRAMEGKEFFRENNLLWVERLLLSFKIASVIPLVLFLIIAPQADDPGFLVLLTVVTLFLWSLTTITSLLKDQITLKIEV